MTDLMSDSVIRQALLGTWQLVGVQEVVDGTLVKPFGDDPRAYLVYTPDGHVFTLFEPMMHSRFGGYAGTFEVTDGQALPHIEFGGRPEISGRTFTRSVALDDERLILGTPENAQLEWWRVR